jgi:hypothetical protein
MEGSIPRHHDTSRQKDKSSENRRSACDRPHEERCPKHEAIFPIQDGTVKSADKHFDDDDKLDAKHIEHIARIGEVQHSECQVGTEALNSARTVGHEDKLQQTSRKPCFSSIIISGIWLSYWSDDMQRAGMRDTDQVRSQIAR